MFGIFNKDPQKRMNVKTLKEFQKLVKEKKYEAAIKAGERYIKNINGTNPDVLYAIAGIYHIRGKHKQALPYLDKALEIASYDTEILHVKATVHLHLKDLKNALVCYKKILDIDPEDKTVVGIIEQIESSDANNNDANNND